MDGSYISIKASHVSGHGSTKRHQRYVQIHSRSICHPPPDIRLDAVFQALGDVIPIPADDDEDPVSISSLWTPTDRTFHVSEGLETEQSGDYYQDLIDSLGNQEPSFSCPLPPGPDELCDESVDALDLYAGGDKYGIDIPGMCFFFKSSARILIVLTSGVGNA